MCGYKFIICESIARVTYYYTVTRDYYFLFSLAFFHIIVSNFRYIFSRYMSWERWMEFILYSFLWFVRFEWISDSFFLLLLFLSLYHFLPVIHTHTYTQKKKMRKIIYTHAHAHTYKRWTSDTQFWFNFLRIY